MTRKVDELRQKTIGELQKEAAEIRHELAKLRFDHALGQLKDTSLLKKRKKDLARILTVIRQKEILEKEE